MKRLGTILSVLMLLGLAFAAKALAAINVYAEGAYTGTELMVDIYADLPVTEALISGGVSLQYKVSQLTAPNPEKNRNVWFIGDPNTVPPGVDYFPPKISESGDDGEIIFILGRLDTSVSNQTGVTGNRVLLGTVIFQLNPNYVIPSPPAAPFTLNLDFARARTDFNTSFGQYVNFASVDGMDLDSEVNFFPVVVCDYFDEDGDGIDTLIEENAPNIGDANADGVADSQQADVGSLVSRTTSDYYTVDASISGNGSSLTDVITAAEPASDGDPLYNYPFGLVEFTVNNPTPGFSGTVRVYFHGVTDLTDYVYRKYNPYTDTWYTLPTVSFGTAMVGGSSVAYADIPYTDGGNSDADLSANGTIFYIGGAALPVSVLEGDINHDCIVNLADFNILRANWLKSGTNIAGDINGDGIVNLSDFNVIRANWLVECP